MKLLTELTVESTEIVSEEKDGKKSLFITGPFLVADKVNRNGRLYASTVIEAAVRDYKADYIDKNRALGTVNHPQTPTTDYLLAALNTKELVREGSTWMGKAKILEETNHGKVLAALVREGVPIGVSSRGLGTITENNVLKAKVVGSDYRLFAIDAVSDPSGPGCWTAALSEGADWVFDAASGDWRVQEQIEETRKLVRSLSKSQLEEQTLGLFARYMDQLVRK